MVISCCGCQHILILNVSTVVQVWSSFSRKERDEGLLKSQWTEMWASKLFDCTFTCTKVQQKSANLPTLIISLLKVSVKLKVVSPAPCFWFHSCDSWYFGNSRLQPWLCLKCAQTYYCCLHTSDPKCTFTCTISPSSFLSYHAHIQEVRVFLYCTVGAYLFDRQRWTDVRLRMQLVLLGGR